MYKIMTLDLKKLLLSRKQNYECVRRLFVFPKRARCRTFKQEVADAMRCFPGFALRGIDSRVILQQRC
jgi:hypothetical protein